MYDKTDLSGESMMQVFRCNCFRNGKAYDDSSHWQRDFVCEGVGGNNDSLAHVGRGVEG